MPVSKIKNLILLILALSVVCLLFLAVPMRTAQIQAEDALHAQLEELFASYDIQLDRAILPRSVDLYTVELSGQQADNAAAAAALLGADAALQPDSSHYAATYLSPAGSCTFRAGGGFSAALTGGESTSDMAGSAARLLKKMGFDAESVSAPERQSAGVYTLTARQRVFGVRVLSGGLTLTYTNGVLTKMEGTFLTGVSQAVRTGSTACISCASLGRLRRRLHAMISNSLRNSKDSCLHFVIFSLQFIPNMVCLWCCGGLVFARSANQGMICLCEFT